MENMLFEAITQLIIVLIAIAVSGVTSWLKAKKQESINRGQKEEVLLIERIVFNAVEYAQQKFKESNGSVKFDAALDKIQSELSRYGINITDNQLEMFMESAVKSMKENNALIKNDITIKQKECEDEIGK